MAQWYMEQLKSPLRTGLVGLRGAERQNIYNLARRQIQGGARAEAEQMRTLMGGRGFRAGESGIADTAIQQALRAGTERLGALSGQLAAEEAQRRSQERLQLAGLNLQRMTGAGQIGAQFAQAGAQRAAARMAQETALKRLGWEKERFKEYEYPYQQQTDAWKRLQWLYGSMLGQQAQDWDRYAGGL
ncbi:MAG: hypothetical protein JRI45_06810 [Deltaproteobacteria bacterium]|nr:hypothetical protein [Deltaproteobacteria bacterium]